MEKLDGVPHICGRGNYLRIFKHESGHIDDTIWILFNNILPLRDVSDRRLEGLSEIAPSEIGSDMGLESLHVTARVG